MQEMDVLADFLTRLFFIIRNFVIYPYLNLKIKRSEEKKIL